MVVKRAAPKKAPSKESDGFSDSDSDDDTNNEMQAFLLQVNNTLEITAVFYVVLHFYVVFGSLQQVPAHSNIIRTPWCGDP